MSEKKEYIERDAVYKALRLFVNVDGCEPSTTEIDMDIFEAIPAADVEPVVRGEWEWFCEVDSTTNGYEEDYGWRCSGCRAKLTDYIADGDVYDEYPVMMKRCPNCGARMERSGSGE